MPTQFPRVISALLLPFACSSALSGPPLTLDDPGILDPGQWEFITAFTETASDAGRHYQTPIIGISLGVIENAFQLGLALPYSHAAPSNGGSEWDFGNLNVGAKWRFFEKNQLQMSFAPYYSFGVRSSAARQGIGNETDVVAFPVNAAYQINDTWRLNSELRYLRPDTGQSSWGYGAAVAYILNQRHELLFGLAGASDRNFDNRSLDVRVGVDAAITDAFHFLFSVGTGLNAPNGASELNHDFFLGFKLLR